MGLALGGSIVGSDQLEFSAGYVLDEYAAAALNFLAACTSEASMMARGAGKTNIHSLEPEDLRSITVATARDTGIPLAGMQQGQVV